MPNRSENSSQYRYGFNGKEKDDEVKGQGNSYDFGARIYDPRIAKFLSLDPKAAKYPGISQYNYSLNNPILFVENHGEDAKITVTSNENGGGSIAISTTVHLYGPSANNDLAISLNNDFAKLGSSGTYTDPETGEVWNVTISVNYVYDVSLEEASKAMGLPDGDNRNFKSKPLFIPDGENIMYLDNNINSKGTAHGQGGNTAIVGETSKGNIFHEAGHQLGFDDRYNLGGLVQVIGDIMASSTAGENIAPIHFEDIVKFVLLSYPVELNTVGSFDTTTHLEPIDDTSELTPEEMLDSGASENVTDIE